MVRLNFFMVATCAAGAIATNLNITALIGKNGVSTFECWALHPAITTVHQPGLNGVELLGLGDLANATYTVWPPNFTGSPHNDPIPQ
jgi:hypothetical protein